jgi:hypothetical protein
VAQGEQFCHKVAESCLLNFSLLDTPPEKDSVLVEKTTDTSTFAFIFGAACGRAQ